MTELILKKGTRRTILLMYDDIEQMPIERFNKINKYWMLQDNIGSSIGDFDTNHYSKLIMLLDDKAKLKKQLENFRILVYNIQNEINVEQLSFACMIHSINGNELSDFSETGLKKTLTELSKLGLTQDILKKKQPKQEKASLKHWKHIFPKNLKASFLKHFGKNKNRK